MRWRRRRSTWRYRMIVLDANLLVPFKIAEQGFRYEADRRRDGRDASRSISIEALQRRHQMLCLMDRQARPSRRMPRQQPYPSSPSRSTSASFPRTSPSRQ